MNIAYTRVTLVYLRTSNCILLNCECIYSLVLPTESILHVYIARYTFLHYEVLNVVKH